MILAMLTASTISELIVGLPHEYACVCTPIFIRLDKSYGYERYAELSTRGYCEVLQNMSVNFMR